MSEDLTGIPGPGEERYVNAKVVANREKYRTLVLSATRQPQGQDTFLKVGPQASISKEALAHASLEHPHIVPVLDYYEKDGRGYMVTKEISGGSLVEKLLSEKDNPFTPAESAGLVLEIASAVDFINSKNKIHRDIKPGNILVSGDKHTGFHAYLADMEFVTDTYEDSRYIYGTPAFMSPEQAMGKLKPGDSEEVPVALVAFRLLAPKNVVEYIPGADKAPSDPVERGNHYLDLMVDLNGLPEEARVFLENKYSKNVADVFEKALKKDKAARYKNATEFAQVLEGAIQSK